MPALPGQDRGGAHLSTEGKALTDIICTFCGERIPPDTHCARIQWVSTTGSGVRLIEVGPLWVSCDLCMGDFADRMKDLFKAWQTQGFGSAAPQTETSRSEKNISPPAKDQVFKNRKGVK